MLFEDHEPMELKVDTHTHTHTHKRILMLFEDHEPMELKEDIARTDVWRGMYRGKENNSPDTTWPYWQHFLLPPLGWVTWSPQSGHLQVRSPG